MTSPAPFFSLRIVLAIQGLLCFYSNFKIICSSPVEKAISMLLWIALSLELALGAVVILTTFQSGTWHISPSVCVVFRFIH